VRTGLVWHERFMWHDTGSAVIFWPPNGVFEPDTHAENPATKRRLKNILDGYDLTDKLHVIRPREATPDELMLFHTADYIDRVAELSKQSGGAVGEGAVIATGGYQIAALSAGGVIEAAHSVLRGDVDNAYALIRPPGHHAERDTGRGFCVFGNIALAVLHAKASGLCQRVAVIDWDVHHGNGTEQAFYSDPSVLTISLHCEGLYPWNTGDFMDSGIGDGQGFNLNIPLQAGAGFGAYEYAFERLVEPAVRAFEPDFIVIACGFDACAFDPNGRMTLGARHYRSLTRRVKSLATEFCGGKLLAVHEGGYSAPYVPFCGLAVIEELSELTSGASDPFDVIISAFPAQILSDHQKNRIEAIAAHAGLNASHA
jgi:acetoin utilization deacetylase AcuC-like enzyme